MGLRIWDGAVFRRIWFAVEVLALSGLILLTRCANYQDVFIGGNIYFTDADCYARMTRVRICAERPGTIVRHHDFENFPKGTNPHVTAPLDYLIVTLSILLRPFTPQPMDLAGAIVSPLLALIGGWFLWWWSRRTRIPYRWAMLILYAISPILVHGTELGRPDHQSLLILLVTIGLCSELSLQSEPSRSLGVVSGMAWALALWVSFYEPLILLAVVLLTVALTQDRHLLHSRHRRTGWLFFAVVIAIALLVERRMPSLSIFQSGALFQNWSKSIGELAPVSLRNRIWFVWAGYMIAIAPLLIWIGSRQNQSTNKSRTASVFIIALLVATFGLTIWQARWSYFFVLIFAIALPSLLSPINPRVTVWAAFGLSILPLLQFWDAKIWPIEFELARRIERQNEATQLRQLAISIRSERTHAFLAPWWLSPSISYWSGQPAVAGSSHESLEGIADSARFFLAEDYRNARQILAGRQVEWVFAYDWDRVGRNSADLLGIPIGERLLGSVLSRTPAQAPADLVLAGQNGAAKLFRFVK